MSFLESLSDDESPSITRKLPLHNYQKKLVTTMQSWDTASPFRGGILSPKMGLGKSIISLEHSIQRYEQLSVPSLIVCENAMMSGWVEEIEKYCDCSYLIFHKDFLPTIGETTISKLIKYHFIVTSYETVNKQLTLLSSLKWNCVYLDESQRIANSKTLIFSSVVCLKAYTRWCISGTPLQNYASDLLSQFKFLNPTGSVACDLLGFEGKEYDSDLSKRILVLLPEEVKDEVSFPDSQVHDIFLDLSPVERQIYDKYRGWSNDIYRGYTRGKYTYGHLFGMIMKLRQLAISPKMCVSKEDKVYTELNEEQLQIVDSEGESTKIFAIIDIVQKIPQKEKCLIFTSFTESINLIKEALESRNIECLVLNGKVKGKKRVDTIKQFKNDSDIKVFIVNIFVGGQGLNLPVANHVIDVENWWCPAKIDQANCRVIRPTQTRDVHIYKLFCKDTIEERIEETCKMKREMYDKYLSEKNKKPDITVIRRWIN